MIVYIDLLFLLNVIYDGLILLTINITLKRRVKFKRIVVGSIVGGLTTFILLLNLNNILLFLLKISLGIIMLLITFRFKNILYTLENLIYLYMISVILAGFLYYLELEFKYANYILLLIIAPIILYLYVNEQKKLKEKINYSRVVKIILKNNKELLLDGFIDSGNRLRDPITKKYIILVNKNLIDRIYNIRSPIYVPTHTINNSSLLECISIKQIEVDGVVYKNYLVGLSDYIKSGYNCLLNYKILEDS